MALLKEAKRKRARKAAQEYRKENRTYAQKCEAAQKPVNRYVRARDSGKPCISCGGPLRLAFGGAFDCGHYRSRGAASSTRYDVLNLAAQCVECNQHRSGESVEMRKGLIERYGLARIEEIEHRDAKRKYTDEELQRIEAVYKRKAKHYEKLNAEGRRR